MLLSRWRPAVLAGFATIGAYGLVLYAVLFLFHDALFGVPAWPVS